MWRWLLLPFSWLYGAVLFLRHWAYDKGIFTSVKFDFPVIVVGNLSAGGTGKTPQTLYLAQLLRSYQPALLSRGYGRTSKGFRWVNEQDSALDVGDEPLLFKRALGTLPVAVCEDRVAGIQRIDKEKSPGLILLDDAFQHRKLVPGFSVLLMDYKSFSHPLFLLPAGNERDLWSRRKKANVVVITKCPASITDSDKNRILSKLDLEDTNDSIVFFSQLMYGHARSFDFLNILDTSLTNRPVILVTGIAKPEQMFSDVSKQTRVLKHLSFRDHYNFTRADVELMKKNMAMFADQRPLFLTTSKDRVRIEPLLRPDELKDWLELPIETSIDDPKRFNTLIENYVKSNQRNGSLHP